MFNDRTLKESIICTSDYNAWKKKLADSIFMKLKKRCDEPLVKQKKEFKM